MEAFDAWDTCMEEIGLATEFAFEFCYRLHKRDKLIKEEVM